MIKRFLLKKARVETPGKVLVHSDIKSVFFVHIPKTAGTSFKDTLAESTNLYRDYGERSPETHQDIQQLYKKTDFYHFKSQFVQGSSICGHVGIMKYADLVDAERIVTFVRKPVGQVVSHYNHFSTQYGYKGSFETFVRDAKFANLQAKYLANFPLELIGFIGLTEHYDASISMLSEHLNLPVECKQNNISKDKRIESAELSPEQILEIKQYNAQDEELYQNAEQLYKQRQIFIEQGKKWTYLHGQINANFALHGCAFFADSTEVVTFDVLINGQYHHTVEAKQFYGGYPKFNLPRERYIGFHLPLKKALKKGDNEVELQVVSTGQSRKIIIKKP